jgi:hypothetical protein
MKKAICMIALAAISISSVFAYGTVTKTHDGTTQTDTTKTKKKWKHKKTKKDSTKKDTTAKM